MFILIIILIVITYFVINYYYKKRKVEFTKILLMVKQSMNISCREEVYKIIDRLWDNISMREREDFVKYLGWNISESKDEIEVNDYDEVKRRVEIFRKEFQDMEEFIRKNGEEPYEVIE